MRNHFYINRCQSLLFNLFFLHIRSLVLFTNPRKPAATMPRSGYSREDPVARRSGYVSYDNNPVDRRGGQESHSGRLNLARMNEHASPDKFLPFLDPRSRHRHEPRDRLFSSTATDLTDIPSRDDLYRSEPSQEFERRTRGYNPGHFGERLPSHGSSPQLGGLDHGYLGKFALFPSRTYFLLIAWCARRCA